MKSKHNILVVLWLAGSAGRKQLTGLLKFINRQHPWNVRILSDPALLTAEDLSPEGGLDGFIGHADDAVISNLAALNIPTVLMDYPPSRFPRHRTVLTILTDDDEGIGRTAVDYFATLGNFASYAFVPDRQNRGWSRLRQRGFVQTLNRAGRSCTVLHPGPALGKGLEGLAKPAAVFCAYDFIAQEVLTACEKRQLNVPSSVAVLGVDNDELICDYSEPSLSSVRIDHEAFGYRSARELDRLLTTRRPPVGPRILRIPGQAVVERASTRPIPPITTLVSRIRKHIADHLDDPLDPETIAAAFGLSRRHADRRFKEATGFTIRQYVEDTRLARIQQQLEKTSLPIGIISRNCGYANVQRLKYVFKSRVGMSMRDYRRTRAAHP